MLMPKRTKYRKMMKGRMTGIAYRGSTISFGEYGLQALEPAWINSRQIEVSPSISNQLFEAWWQGLDPDLPGQAGHEEAG